ncbi:MAG: T9SS type A sorting domain-containing protein [candidate division WOR-3 bacterium]
MNTHRVLLAACLGAGAALALVTRYVGPERNPPHFKTVAAACSSVSRRTLTEEHLFLIDPGTYTGACEISNCTTWYYPLTFRPLKAGTVTLDAAGAQTGFYVYNTDNVKLESLNFTGAATSAVYFYNTHATTPFCKYCRISGCTITGNAYYGIRMEGVYDSDSVIGNRVLNTNLYGIYFNWARPGQCVFNNYVSGWTYQGISLNDMAYGYCYGNTVLSPTGSSRAAHCVNINDCASWNVYNNIFWSRNTNTNSACIHLNNSAQPKSKHNNLWKAAGSNIAINGATKYSSMSHWQGVGFDTNSISLDPQLAPGDYHLQPSSPCIGRARPFPDIPRDIDGDPRDAEPDIGCDEYCPTILEEGARFPAPGTGLRIEPNPTRGQVAVRIPPSADRSELRFFDSQGRCVLHHPIPSSLHQSFIRLDLRDLAPGVYLVRLTAGGLWAGTKLIVR